MNELTFTGVITNCSGLQEAPAKNGTMYRYYDLELRADDASQQSLSLHLLGEMAVQLSTCEINPGMQACAHISLFCHEFQDREGIWRKTNEISCWKLDVMDKEFTCRRFR